jgi:hypothetical protein
MDLDRMKVTPRDQQVLDLLVQGCSNKEIATQLSIYARSFCALEFGMAASGCVSPPPHSRRRRCGHDAA